MKIGIEKISLYVPKKYISTEELAKEKNIDKNKYLIGLMQYKISITNEQIVDMGLKSAMDILENIDKNDIGLVIFATESSNDLSKANSIIVASKLNLPKNIRCIEFKQACYSGTAALLMARDYVKCHNKKVLIIMSDIAKYGIDSPGEPTQGAGSISLLVSNNPNIAVINDYSEAIYDDIYDFYRPINKEYPIVDGKLSIEIYKKMFFELIDKFNVEKYSAICFHIPYPKLPLKVLNEYLDKNNFKNSNELKENFNLSILYNQNTGNIYTGSLYLSLISLLNNKNMEEKNILMYSYGSGATAEIFSLKISKNYNQYMKNYSKIFENRVQLNYNEYLKIFYGKE